MTPSIAPLTRSFASTLADPIPPCISIYQPTHRRFPENQQDPLRFKNLVKELQQTLSHDLAPADAIALVEPLERLAADQPFWNHSLDGLAVFASPKLFEIIRIPHPVPQLMLVADSFHTKPLRRILQGTGRFQVLCLSRQSVRLFEGNRDALDEAALASGVPRSLVEALGEELTESHSVIASYGGVGAGRTVMFQGQGDGKDEKDVDDERFFRAVAKAVHQHHSQVSKLPLLLAALPEHHALFQQVSQNPWLEKEGLRVNPEALSSDELRQRAWEVIGPREEARLVALAEDFTDARAKGLGSDVLEEVAEAAVASRVSRLWIEADRHFPGRLDPTTGAVTPPNAADRQVDDLLDDLADLVEERGGEVLVTLADQMPSTSGIAATFRF